MSGRGSLRRSRRATRKASDYNVGDIVEINRGGTTVKATLAQLLTESSASPNPRWLIKYGSGSNHKDEEVYEHTFGRVIQYADSPTPEDGDDVPVGDGPTGEVPPTTTSTSLGNERIEPVVTEVDAGKMSASLARPRRNSKTIAGSNTASPDGAAASSGNEGKNSKKNVTFSNDDASSSDGGDGASSSGFGSATGGSKSSKVSAREQRSRRRQAMIDETPAELSAGGGLSASNNSSNGGNNTSSNARKRNRGGNRGGSSRNRKRSRKDDRDTRRQKTNANGERCVTKMKLLTGTLYIYRGPDSKQARAEFVRRV